MENKLQNLKFRVYSEQHSKAIQERLFELNKEISWVTGSRETSWYNEKYLFLENENLLHICEDEIDYPKYTLCTLDDLYKMQSETTTQSEPNPQSELMTKLENLQKELDKVKEEISKLNK